MYSMNPFFFQIAGYLISGSIWHFGTGAPAIERPCPPVVPNTETCNEPVSIPPATKSPVAVPSVARPAVATPVKSNSPRIPVQVNSPRRSGRQVKRPERLIEKM